nr:retrovirus-related Pol polyprotein from transposon TNT 1-94 [Tanacetum cinerariifolium]
MYTPTFAKTHNLIAYLDKPTESEGFAQIINFLNGSSVKYALTVSPTIHTSCIKQFWTSAKVKTVNDEVAIQALVDGKRINIKESSIIRILMLKDTDGTSCLNNAEIFEGLARMGTKTSSWNEFSSTMASAIICLATNQNFNFSRISFATPLLTKKVFANMKRVGTGFIKEVISLFDNMLVYAPEEVAEHNLPSPSHDPLPSGEDSLKLKELMDFYTNLSNKVLDLESKVIDIKSTYQARIEKLESRVEKLEEEKMMLKELKSVHSTVDFDEPVMEKEKSSRQWRKIADIDDDVEIKPADVEEVLEVVKVAKLITEVVTTVWVDVNAASVQHTPITTAKATKVIVPRKRRDATPLALKIPIIEYKIHIERNRPNFKIIRTDGNHKLFLSFSTMLKNFDREDLESLWIIVRERFAKTEPKNYSDEFLLNTLKIMFEKPNVKANTHFTLEQILNDVRHKVEDKSEMSLELLRLVRRQLNEGKQAHASYKAKNIVSTTRCLELLHMDLFGPSAVRSYEGNRYTLVTVDDYSRKVKESVNVTFNETPPPYKTSPLVDDDLDEEEAIKDFNTKFYNSLGRAPNRCSSSIGKTRGAVIVHLRNRLGRLDQGLTEF